LNKKIIYIVDDEVSVRTTLENVFRLASFVVHAFDNPFSAIESSLETKNSCILLDLSMPEMDGIEFQKRLHEKLISIPIVFYTGKADIDSAVDAMSGGAFTLVRKPAANSVLIEKVLDAIKKHKDMGSFSDESEQAFATLQILSKRELQVALLVANGETAAYIAEHLFISRRTVEAHRANTFEKLEIKSVARLAQLVQLAKVHLV
jgi:two-component system response regulator FixJ